ncbi:UNKNOWN [Stylonychia lemnae]|uniref:Uncharacterized protein n=1 Tax=Stylonychia lemnae TaxID=5949 RepID=A0A077ZTG5_STYLE|nr:UNKNOWN [Stylonychia lemnae]|eukprot:CDW73177.1 UNKNOWN [Stylonychia lemnae]
MTMTKHSMTQSQLSPFKESSKKLKKKRKQHDGDSISSFDSNLEENKKDQHLMITKKNRKDLTDYNDKLYERSMELERVMDLLMNNLAHKGHKKYQNSKNTKSTNGVFMENIMMKSQQQSYQTLTRTNVHNSKDQSMMAADSHRKFSNATFQLNDNLNRNSHSEFLQLQQQHQINHPPSKQVHLYKMNNYQYSNQTGLHLVREDEVLNKVISNQSQQRSTLQSNQNID